MKRSSKSIIRYIFSLVSFLLTVFFGGSITSCEHHCPMPIETVVPKKDSVVIRDSVIVRDSVVTRDSVVVINIVRRRLEIRPTPDADNDTWIHEVLSSANNINASYLIQANWTRFGATAHYRTLTKFDLSSIEPSEVIKTAILHVTPRPPDATDNEAMAITREINNDVQFCIVKDSWDVQNVTWLIQPSFFTSGLETKIFAMPSKVEDIPVKMNFDITSLVKQIAGKSLKYSNNGFMIKMAYEEIPEYQSFSFFSTNAASGNRPYLEIVTESIVKVP